MVLYLAQYLKNVAHLRRNPRPHSSPCKRSECNQLFLRDAVAVLDAHGESDGQCDNLANHNTIFHGNPDAIASQVVVADFDALFNWLANEHCDALSGSDVLVLVHGQRDSFSDPHTIFHCNPDAIADQDALLHGNPDAFAGNSDDPDLLHVPGVDPYIFCHAHSHDWSDP